MTAHADNLRFMVRFMFKILDVYNVKSYAFVKFANSATISQKKLIYLI